MAARTGVVQVSGRGSNVDFTIDDSAPFSQITKGLRDYLVENRELWSKGTIGVNAGRWMLSQDQLGLIKHIIETESGLTVGRFWCPPSRLEAPGVESSTSDPNTEPPSTESIMAIGNVGDVGDDGASYQVLGDDSGNDSRPDSGQSMDTSAEKEPEPPPSVFPKLKVPKTRSSRKGLPTEALFVKTTFRSGESITYHGDVIVLADVNPGAEIIAEGDIVVFGSLRGMAHAGSAGDTRATIIALELDSPRIQIGPYTGLAPTVRSGSKSGSKAGSNSMRAGPKIAYTRRRSIYVSPYAGRFAKYSRGILYDG